MMSASAHKIVTAFAALVAAGLLCASCSASQPLANTSPPTDAEKHARFFAVTHAGDYIVAANSNGFFRANASTKKWERLAVPVGMSPQGQFAASKTDSNSVFYWPYSFGKKGSLYLSQDAGVTWKSICDDYSFKDVYPNHGGKIYAIALKQFKSKSGDLVWTDEKTGISQRSLVLVSENGGKNWKDITANIGAGMELVGIFPHPTFSNRVCVSGCSIRGYVLEPVDDNYSKWKSTVAWEWQKDSQTDDDFMRGYYGTTTTLHMLNANLYNYFDYNFGNSPQIQAFVVDVDTNHLEFASGKKIQLPITVKFLPDYAPVKLADATNNQEFWRIQCICPDGRRVSGAGRTNQFERTDDSEKLKHRIGDDTGFLLAELTPTNSFSRFIALDKLVDFSKPGVYRIRLSYDSMEWGWDDNHKKNSGIWGGGFSSPIFTLTIKP